MTVDLRKCIPGDKLLTKSGMTLTYVQKIDYNEVYPHRIRYPGGGRGTRTDDGFIFRENMPGMVSDYDIVEILPRNEETMKFNVISKRSTESILASQMEPGVLYCKKNHPKVQCIFVDPNVIFFTHQSTPIVSTPQTYCADRYEVIGPISEITFTVE